MNLRETVLRGGAYLAVRQVLSLAIHLVGVLLLTRTIGPQAYGLYAAVFGIQAYLFALAQCGLNVYLVRRGADDDPTEQHQVFTLLLAFGLGAVVIAQLALPLIGWVSRLAGIEPVARVMFLVLPIQVAGVAAGAQLERALDYRNVAMAELIGTLAFYAVALPLALANGHTWAPVAGFWTQQVVLASLYYWRSGYRPRLVWQPSRIGPILRYGVGYSGATWVWQLRELVNPLIVGRYAGAAAVGYVAFTVRLVDALSFAKSAVWRLSIAVLARLQHDVRRLTEAVSEGMVLQALTVGPVLVSFGLVAPTVIQRLYGPRWAPILEVYPFVALAYLTNALFNLHSSALFVLKRTWDVGLFHAAHIVLFACSTLILVPRFGVVGYGWGEMVALMGYVVVHERFGRSVGRPSYDIVLVCWMVWASLLFWRTLGWWCLVAPAVALAWPGVAYRLRRYVVNVTGWVYAK